MPAARLERETRRAAENLSADRAWRRNRMWHVVAGALCVAAGLVISGAAFAVNDRDLGNLLIVAGVTIGDVGVLAVVMVYAYTSER